MSAGTIVQAGLVADPQLRADFRRFLGLLAALDPRLVLREEPFVVLAELEGRTLCACRPRANAVQVRLGPAGEGEVPCRSHEDFVDILARLLAQQRVAAGVGADA